MHARLELRGRTDACLIRVPKRRVLYLEEEEFEIRVFRRPTDGEGAAAAGRWLRQAFHLSASVGMEREGCLLGWMDERASEREEDDGWDGSWEEHWVG